MIERLWLNNVRNLKELDFEPGARFNLILGPNGSGKTALLEAIYILGSGRSFLQTELDSMINFDSSEMAVGGLVHQKRLAFRKHKGTPPQVSLNTERVNSGAVLAREIPLAVVQPDSQILISGAPLHRRQYLDGVVFHVEHQFHKDWREYRRGLRQRNVELRKGRTDMLKHWDTTLLPIAENITQTRQKVVEQLQSVFDELLQQSELNTWLSRFTEGVRLSLWSGWAAEQTLAQTWARDSQSDLALGYTQRGPHCADLRISIAGRRVRGQLSRAEQRLLAILLVMAKVLLLRNQPQAHDPVLLLDDVTSELDIHSVQSVISLVASQDVQSFWTSPNEHLSNDLLSHTPKVFHVEHLIGD